MFKNMEQLFNHWHARMLTVSALVAAAVLVAAPSLARVNQTGTTASCSGDTLDAIIAADCCVRSGPETDARSRKHHRPGLARGCLELPGLRKHELGRAF